MSNDMDNVILEFLEKHRLSAELESEIYSIWISSGTGCTMITPREQMGFAWTETEAVIKLRAMEKQKDLKSIQEKMF
jgi:hypothetical protein